MGDNAAPVATQADDAQVTIRLITRLPADFKVPETAVAVPASINRYGLSQIINALLQLQPHRPFDFLVNGTLLRGSLAQCVEALHLSAEDVVDIEYTLAVLPPKPRAALPHDDWVSCLALPGGVLVSGAYDGCLRAWTSDVDAPASATTGAHDGPVTALAAFAVDKATAGLVSGGKDGALLVWAVPLGPLPAADDGFACVRSLTGMGASVSSVAANPSGRKCVGGGWNGALCVWDLPDVTEALPAAAAARGGEGGKRVAPTDRSLPETAATAELAGHTDCVAAAAWPAPNTAVTGGWDHSVRLWDVGRGEAVYTHHGSKAVYAVAPQPGGGNLVAFGGADNALRLWDPRYACNGGVTACAYAMQCNNREREGASVAVRALTSHRHWVSGVAWRPGNEHQLVTCSHDKTVKLWDVRSDIPLHSVEGATDKLLAVMWLDANRLAAGGADKQLHLFSLQPTVLE